MNHFPESYFLAVPQTFLQGPQAFSVPHCCPQLSSALSWPGLTDGECAKEISLSLLSYSPASAQSHITPAHTHTDIDI